MLQCALHLIGMGMAAAIPAIPFRLHWNGTGISDESLCLAVDPEAPDVVKTEYCSDGDRFVWIDNVDGHFRHSSGKCMAYSGDCDAEQGSCTAEVKDCVECSGGGCFRIPGWEEQQWTFGCASPYYCPGSVHLIKSFTSTDGYRCVQVGEVGESATLQFPCNMAEQLFYKEFLDGPDPTSEPGPEPAPDPTPEPGTDPTPAPMAGVQIKSNASSLCVDLPGGETTIGALLWTWDCYGGDTQQWAFQDGQWVYLPDPSKCVDMIGGDSTTGNQLGLCDCNGGNSQMWGFDEEWGTIYLASSAASDASKCVQIGGENRGDPVVIWDCTIEPQQIWTVGPPPPSAVLV